MVTDHEPWNHRGGGFFLTSHGAEHLSRINFSSAEVAGNSVGSAGERLNSSLESSLTPPPLFYTYGAAKLDSRWNITLNKQIVAYNFLPKKHVV